MEHVAIDLGSKESQVCVRSEAGEVVAELRMPTRSLSEFLGGRPKSRVVVETCNEAFRVADSAMAHGHEVRVVPATFVRSLGLGQRGLKNDQRDARVLSEASCRINLPSVHIPSTRSREMKAICTSREVLVKSRTQIVSSIRSYARSRLTKTIRATPESLPAKLRDALLETEEGLPAHVERLVLVLESLNEQIKAADQELGDVATANELTTRLMTVPGVGPVTAVRFVAAIDKVDRFENGSLVTSYLGLTPGENTTGFKTKRTRLTKAGAPQVRWALGQAAWSLFLRRKEDPMVRWAKQVAERRGRHVAITALARKLALVLFAMWRDGTTYRTAASVSCRHRFVRSTVSRTLRNRVNSTSSRCCDWPGSNSRIGTLLGPRPEGPVALTDKRQPSQQPWVYGCQRAGVESPSCSICRMS